MAALAVIDSTVAAVLAVEDAQLFVRALEVYERDRRLSAGVDPRASEWRQRLSAAAAVAHQRRLITAANAATTAAIRGAGGNGAMINTPEVAAGEGDPCKRGDDFVSVKDAAVHLGVKERWVRELIASSQLPAHRLGRAWRIDRADLEALQRSRES